MAHSTFAAVVKAPSSLFVMVLTRQVLLFDEMNFFYFDKAYNAAHGTTITPIKVDQESAGKDTIYVCGCGQSKKRASGESYACDGSHKALLVDLEAPAN